MRAAVVLVFGFLAGASAVAYLVLSDPEVRGIFRAKSNRITSTGWTGISKEVARSVVMELRDAYPKIFREGGI